MLQRRTQDSNSGLHIKEMVELILKPCKSDTFYTTIKVPLRNPEETVEIDALIDSGAGIGLIDKTLAKKYRLTQKELETPIVIRNSDGTIAKNKKITKYTNIRTTIDG